MTGGPGEASTLTTADPRPAGGEPPLVQLEKLSKRFGPSYALVEVDLELRAGEVHGLVGANGSGKSTLVKIFSGYHTPEEGAAARLHGEPVDLPLRPAVLERANIGFVHQDLGLVDELSVLENLWLTRLSQAHAARLPWGRLEEVGAKILDRYQVDVPLQAQVGDLSQARRALLAIARAAAIVAGTLVMPGARATGTGDASRGGVLVLDEATVFLSGMNRELLQRIVRQVTDDRGAVLVITHDLDEVVALSDRILVLRDGRSVALLRRDEADRAELARLIVGSASTAAQSSAPSASSATASAKAQVASTGPSQVLSVTALRSPDAGVDDVTFNVRPGEILGFAGLVGSGFDQVGGLLFGARQAASGRLSLGDQVLTLGHLTPTAAIAAGLAYIPAGRGSEGLLLDLSVQENLMAQVLGQYVRAGLLRERAMRARAEEIAEQLDIRCRSLEMACAELSGGNQQKVLLGKWLESEPSALVLQEPTQGIDVGAREMIWRTLRRLADQGLIVICASSDHDELARLANRVLVMRTGRVVTELSGADLTKHAITQASLG